VKVLCFGSANIDHTYRVDHFTAPGETQSCLSYTAGCGGKGLNQAAASALAGNDTFFAGMIGKDGLFLKEKMEEKGVDTSLLRVEDAYTGHAIIEVDQSGQNHIVLYGGTNKAITEEYVDSVLEHFGEGDIVILQNEINLIPYIIEQCSRKNMTIFFNAAPFDEGIRSYPIEKVSWLAVNETEGAGLSGEASEDDIPGILRRKYPRTNILFTMGKAGSRVVTDTEDVRIPSCNVPVKDTTGAGDTWLGYFVRGIVMGLTPEESGRLAAAASAISVMGQGAVESIPDYARVMGQGDVSG